MTLQQLRYLQAVVKTRHFGRAAERCRVSQPTLSMQLKKLETELGVALVDRSRTPLELTEVGARVYTAAQRIHGELDDLSAWMLGTTERVEGLIRFAILPTLAPTVLPLLLPALRANHPGLDVDVVERTTRQLIRDIEDDAVDLGLLVTPLAEEHLRTQPIFMEPLCAYVHPDHPAARTPSGELHPEQLDPETMLLLEEGHCFRSQALQLCGAETRGKGLGFRCESGSIETLKRLVDQTGGCTLIPGLEAAAMSNHPAVRRFASPEPAREVSLVTRPTQHRQAVVDAIHRTLTSVVPEEYTRMPTYKRLPWRNL
jgi:LysR family hydrogen peroxide-inducible transcriptional activator